MRLALAGDTMLGRNVAERLERGRSADLFSAEVRAVVREADLFVLNLECPVSARGTPFPDPDKAFFFKAPPAAATVLADLGVSCVTLANNHALDFGVEALLDTFTHLADADVAWVGAGVDESAARAPRVLGRAGARVGILAVTDHPPEYAATRDAPGVAFANLAHGVPDWLAASVESVAADVVVVTPHWGPNMAAAPVPHVGRAARALRRAGAALVAGHSAHVFHGVAPGVLYDLGDFIDDYMVDPLLRNDCGLLFLVTFERAVATHIEAVPLHLDYCRTRLARGEERTWIAARLRRACAPFGTEVREHDDRLIVEFPLPEAASAAGPVRSPAKRGGR